MRSHTQPFDDLNELTTEQIDALRDLRAEAQSLKIVIDNAKVGAYDVKTYEQFIFKTYDDMGKRCLILRATNMRDKEHGKIKSDSISAILNRWEYLVVAVPALFHRPVPMATYHDWIGSGSPPDPFSAASAPAAEDEESRQRLKLRQLAENDDALHYIIMMVGYLTIPERINRWLARNEDEDVISFHRIFEDELPDEADRIRVLGLLASSPKRIAQGILDPVTGLIYRCPKPWSFKQLELLGGIVLAALVCLGLLVSYLVMSYPETTT